MFTAEAAADSGPAVLQPMETWLQQEMFNMFNYVAIEQEVRVFRRGALPEPRTGVDVGCTTVLGAVQILPQWLWDKWKHTNEHAPIL